MPPFTFKDVAVGNCAPLPLVVAESAYDALVANQSVYITENVTRVLLTLKRKRHMSTPHARGLACVLCSVCAHKNITHPLMPSDAAASWRRVQDTIEAWFSEPDTSMESMLATI